MRRIIVVCLMVLLAAGCGRRQDGVTVVMERPDDVSALSDAVEKIELIPLETADGVLVGDFSEIVLLGDSFVLEDRMGNQVVRFDTAGRFLNRIGRAGNGPGEYVGIQYVQADEDVIIFSEPDKMMRYSADGTLIEETHVDNLGCQSCVVPEGILTYYGFGTGREERAALLRKDGTSEPFLPTSAKVIYFIPDTPVFCIDGGKVYFTDSYSPSVFVCSKGSVRQEVSFDFGDAAINENFYHFDDAFASAEYMLSASEFAMVRRYLHGKDYQFLEVLVQKGRESGLCYEGRAEAELCYGICAGDRWKWFSLGSLEDSAFAGSPRALDGSTLYFLLDPGRLSGGAGALAGPLAPLRAAISNPEALDSLKPDDNPVIAKVYLK